MRGVEDMVEKKSEGCGRGMTKTSDARGRERSPFEKWCVEGSTHLAGRAAEAKVVILRITTFHFQPLTDGRKGAAEVAPSENDARRARGSIARVDRCKRQRFLDVDIVSDPVTFYFHGLVTIIAQDREDSVISFRVPQVKVGQVQFRDFVTRDPPGSIREPGHRHLIGSLERRLEGKQEVARRAAADSSAVV